MTTSVQPAPAARVKYKRSLKNYLLDPRFQLKWTGMIIAVAFVISAIMGIFLYRTTSEVTALWLAPVSSTKRKGPWPLIMTGAQMRPI